MDDCQCLPCTLRRALTAWQSTHFLSTEGMVDQLGVFVSRSISRMPEFRGRTIGFAILEECNDGATKRLN